MEIEFFCKHEDAVRYFPPVPAQEIRPQWFKETPFYHEDKKLNAKEMFATGNGHQDMTIKACVPVRDYMEQGYILRYPSDIIITPEQVGDEYGWWIETAKNKFVSFKPHAYSQCPAHIKGRKNVYLKITQPWVVKTPPGYSCFFYQPEFFFEGRFKLFPAVVDTDDFPVAINFPGVVLADETFTIDAGDPMMVVFPFKREKWTHKISCQPPKTNPSDSFLQLGYKKLFHKVKSFR